MRTNKRLAGGRWLVALGMVCAWAGGCAREESRPAPASPQRSAPSAAATSSPSSPPRQECGGQPCCGDPPQPCGSWLAEQRTKAGAVVVEQVPGAGCAVYVDGQEWPEGRRLRAFKFVPPGMHTIECRGPSGVLFSRRLEVAIGRDTPLFWGP